MANSKTAAQAANEAKQELLKQIEILKQLVEKTETETTNWGVAGSLNHSKALVTEISNFLR